MAQIFVRLLYIITMTSTTDENVKKRKNISVFHNTCNKSTSKMNHVPILFKYHKHYNTSPVKF